MKHSARKLDAPLRRRKHRWVLLGLLVIVLVGLATAGFFAIDNQIAAPKSAQASYVGRETCSQCHSTQEQLWTGSPHDRALDLATPKTVLGNFDNQELIYQGVTSKMFRRDGKYFVRTDGRDGKLADFEVKYVIGYNPLQQYMVEFPDGRVQVLRISWDVLGKRWFNQYPPDVKNEHIKPDDPLHWTGPAMNWNHMCAECHSTKLQKNFDVAKNEYHTTFSEIDVSCETCHGPGSLHVDAAKRPWPKWDKNHGYGLPALKGTDSKNQVEACAQCHSRRNAVHPNWQPGVELLNHYAPQTIEERLYHADGQIRDEVYEYGSFVQSKMHAKGIRCSDCHDPHSTKLRLSGNAVCTSCHQHPAGKYDTPAHHHHKPNSSGAACANCHMPTTHYMVVDPRRDHSFRVPRPDLSVKLGTPNACTGCHLEMEHAGTKTGEPGASAPGVVQEASKNQPEFPLYYADYLELARSGDKPAASDVQRLNKWSLEWVEKWYGQRKDAQPHFAFALDAAWRQKPEAEQALVDLVKRKTEPTIVRATAISSLGQYHGMAAVDAVGKALSDPDPLVRAMAVGAAVAQRGESPSRIKVLAPLLNDPVRLVRTEAARALAPFGRMAPGENGLSAGQWQACERALDEYRQGQLANNDQAAAQTNLGGLSEMLGDDEAAAKSYENAIRLDPRFFPAQTQLALLYTRQGKKDRTEQLFRGIIKQAENMTDPQHLLAPVLGDAHYMLGLLLKERPDRVEEAERELLAADKIEPRLVRNAYALATFYAQHGKLEQAESFAEKYAELAPGSPDAAELLKQVRAARAAGRKE
ncbi:MAG: HEAT repeat domain-containing protein [Planctomycetes bacterium]|nr:HEAT repeat domain-containing protein [Planctomycetota bacterium]